MGTGLEGVDENLETGGVSGQLEESHDPDDAEEFQNVVLSFESRQKEVQVERQSGHKVDEVDRCPDEGQLHGADHEPDDQFEGEPGVTDAFDVEEGQVRLIPLLVQHPRLNASTFRVSRSASADRMT